MMDVETPKLLPCPFCGHHAYEPTQVHGQAWGSYDWEIRCSSSHCCANVRIIADGWERNLDAELNKHLPPEQLYDNRELNLRRMWNRRPAKDHELVRIREALRHFVACVKSDKEMMRYHGDNLFERFKDVIDSLSEKPPEYSYSADGKSVTILNRGSIPQEGPSVRAGTDRTTSGKIGQP